MLVFGECCLPCGRPWRDSHALEVTIMPTVPPVTDIPHGFEGALPPAPALHAQAALLPHKLQKKCSFQPVTPTRSQGWVLWICWEMPQTCHQPPDRCHCHTSPSRATSPAPWESPRALPVTTQPCPWETELAHKPL